MVSVGVVGGREVPVVPGGGVSLWPDTEREERDRGREGCWGTREEKERALFVFVFLFLLRSLPTHKILDT